MKRPIPPAYRQGRKNRSTGIMVMLDDGPLQSSVPFPRGDLRVQTPEILLSSWFDQVRYTLDHVDTSRVHHYRYAGALPT